jgi:hypothetical protein
MNTGTTTRSNFNNERDNLGHLDLNIFHTPTLAHNNGLCRSPLRVQTVTHNAGYGRRHSSACLRNAAIWPLVTTSSGQNLVLAGGVTSFVNSGPPEFVNGCFGDVTDAGS